MRFEFELMVEEAKFIEENWMKMCRLLLTKVEGKDIDEGQPLSEGDQLMAFNVLDKKVRPPGVQSKFCPIFKFYEVSFNSSQTQHAH